MCSVYDGGLKRNQMPDKNYMLYFWRLLKRNLGKLAIGYLKIDPICRYVFHENYFCETVPFRNSSFVQGGAQNYRIQHEVVRKHKGPQLCVPGQVISDDDSNELCLQK
uniref:Uncharacterized protein n=1 Tax=Octopus bimaculoides TaxID=37653 RepID=A0A0L8HAN8_OCTBM